MSFTLFGTQRAVVVSSVEAVRDVLVHKQDQFSGEVFTVLAMERDQKLSYDVLMLLCTLQTKFISDHSFR